MSRFQEWLQQTPPTTLFVLLVCATLHVLGQVLFNWDLHQFTLCPRLIIQNHQVYRIVTSALFHGSIMHIGMNMMSLLALGGQLEKRLGTVRFAVVIGVSICATGTLHTTVAYLMSVVVSQYGTTLMNQHSVGFSGVLFHLSVLECSNHHHSSSAGGTTRSVFGFFQVPASLYPWVLLTVLHVLMPGLSFMGHLSGILVGTLHVHGNLIRYILPSESKLKRVDESSVLSSLADRPSYCPTTSDDGGPSSTTGSAGGNVLGGGSRTISSSSPGGYYCLSLCRGMMDTLKVTIFGRGRESNANVFAWADDVSPSSSPSTHHGSGRSSGNYGPIIEPEEDNENEMVEHSSSNSKDRDHHQCETV